MDKASILLDKLIGYAKANFDLSEDDEIITRNRIMDLLGITSYLGEGNVPLYDCNKTSEVLDELHGFLLDEGKEEYELAEYDDKVMGILLPNPSVVHSHFNLGYNEKTDGKKAMEYLYKIGVKSNYVKKEQLDKNPRFDSNGLIITINKTKPEFRDPKKAASGTSVAGGYPKCTICIDNEGYGGRTKRTLRTGKLKLDGEDWMWQYSPFGYFKEHGIAINTKHIPMHVDGGTIQKLIDFVKLVPHYFIGCNAALPRIGGSVLAHDHFQGGIETLPLHIAKIKTYLKCDYSDMIIGVLDWPGTAIRVISGNEKDIISVAEKIINAWNSYDNPSLGLISNDSDGIHHAVSPTVKINGDGKFELTIILRSNITSKEYPDGVFHAHPEFHIIKKESIGLIEAQGLFILPGRLESQLFSIKQLLVDGAELSEDLKDFEFIYNELKNNYEKPKCLNCAEKIIQSELGSVCRRILENTAVFKKEENLIEFLGLAGITK